MQCLSSSLHIFPDTLDSTGEAGTEATEMVNVSFYFTHTIHHDINKNYMYGTTKSQTSCILLQEIELVFKPHPKDHDPETVAQQTRYIKTTAVATGVPKLPIMFF